ncbi:Glycerol kinase [Corynebacterium deserti GIMN1.010]|uniref:Glycerol kinase n=1 Tax=Corynebacterium deserti GIMN1.010 TaxID=931089 RepID=A0A0M5IPR0_9CORY|nr:glycerol kinase GlpK [Corynebacterium deserti]ALC06944.1 Glycerol kinase [Corynebacterium deserti GIMN1.010]
MKTSKANAYVAAIDQGTTSTRCILIDAQGKVVASASKEHEQIFPKQGWVEHDPMEIWDNVRSVVSQAMVSIDITPYEVASVGVTNQRETTIVWDKNTGEPIYNAIVWQDTRTTEICKEIAGDEGQQKWLERTGLLVNSYPAGPKIKWILDNVEGARERAEKGELLFGTIDTWVLWNLTGGVRGDDGDEALHVTDVTNASRTLLMDIRTQQWDPELCEALGVPMSMLPEIRASIGDFRSVRHRGTLADVPITGILGDQQAALFGQGGFAEGAVKNTYGTGLFLLMNTGKDLKISEHGLLSTIAYQLQGEDPVFALEGSVSMGGSLVQWLRDNLQLIPNAPAIENLAREVEDNGGVHVVPAFTGLFAPRWRPDARGIITGLTRFANRKHIARAVLEANAFQTREVVDAMAKDAGKSLESLRVDGAMVENDLLMQIQADFLGIDVQRLEDVETTAVGVAFAAGLGSGFFKSTEQIQELIAVKKVWNPEMSEEDREARYTEWNKAVEHSYDLA